MTLELLKAERAAILAELAAVRSDMAGLHEAAEYLYDEETWGKLESFVRAIRKMRHLQKNARNKKDFATTRELERLVDEGVNAFYKSMKIEEV